MNLGLMIFFGFIRVGLVDQIVDDVAHVEYMTFENEIEHKVLTVGNVDCNIKEGTKVYFDQTKIVGCF
tara:strand:- start:204 stop:407 length:204 start_codon:yes stop_codon:yes gene_type:complete